jgi:MYXO-CTERM domain-containing protein
VTDARDHGDTDRPADAPAPAEESTTLRGASVAVDTRLVGRVAVALCVAGLVVSGVLLLVAGAHKNDQIDALHANGVPTTATVSACIGQLGGSGSNNAGVSCDGTYRLGGHQYHSTLPVSTMVAPGTHLRLVVDRDDPLLVSTPSMVASEHSSSGVFVVPVVLLAAAAAIVGLVLWRRRRSTRSAGRQPAGSSLSGLGEDDRLGALGGV